MKRWAIATLCALAACGTEQPAEQAAADDQATVNSQAADEAPQTATAELRTATGSERGRATATQAGEDIRILVEASGMEPGTYAAHVHMTGRCDPPKFESAGGHWNPTDKQHGRDNPQGMHQGDLPNITAGPDGNAALEFVIPAAVLSGGAAALLDADGAAMMIHARPDDYRTDPSGNAGDRIACGVFG